MVTNVTMVDVLLPETRRRTFAYNCFLILGGAFLIALCAHIKIPLFPVPVTGQTFAILMIAALFGARRGCLSVCAYLAAGAAGLPVFAASPSGIPAFAGPTGGYLVGFVFAAYLVGTLAERGWDRKAGTTVLAMVLGNVVIYAFGLFWLWCLFAAGRVSLGGKSLLAAGVYPFVIGDVLKILLAAGILPGGWKLLEGRDTAKKQ
ncbi:biotin transporter BioY [Planctomycetota bacterium]